MQLQQTATSAHASSGAGTMPATKFGNNADENRYLQGDAEPAKPSVISTNSKFLNNPYFRDAYAQVALRRNGPDVPSTYIIPMTAKAIGEVTDYAEFARLLDEEKIKNPEFGEWLRARRQTSFRSEDVAGCAPGTLGHAIWGFLTGTGYEMELKLKGVEVTNDIDYISKRRGGGHDIEHMVSGFGTNACGELALVWSYITSIANYFTPELAHYMSSGLVFLGTTTLQRVSLHYPAAYPTVLEGLRLGVEMGQALKRPMLLEPWEDMIDWQLDDIAGHLGIARGPGKAWDWTTEATAG